MACEATALSLFYTYDPLNRLIAASGPFGDAAYSYDNVGNRLSQTVNIFTETYTYQPNTNRLAAVSGQNNESYSYNANGSIIVIDSKFLKYNQDNRLTRFIDASGANAITADFTYNAYGQRVSKSSSGATTLFLYDFDGNIIAEADGAGNITTEYLYLGSNRLAKVDTASGNIYFYINDRLGTPIMMVDATNTVVWEATYKPFGEAEVNPTSTVTNNFRFPGQYYDKETGMHYNWHRYYDPNTGSYLTPDPIGLAGGINLFVYVQNNPVNATDPTGLKTYMCKKYLHALGGSGKRTGPDIWGNPLYHQYICVITSDGKEICGGQDRSGGPWSPGTQSWDYYSTEYCKQTDPDNECLEQCLTKAILSDKRPYYGLIGPGTNCQEWANDTYSSCKSKTKGKTCCQ